MSRTTVSERGSRQELEDAFAEHGPRLMGLARTIVASQADAEDAVQMAMERAWRSWDDLRDPARRGAWLTTILVRTALSHRLRLRRLLTGAPGRDGPAQLVEMIPADPDLGRGLGALSRRQRAVIGLHYGHGYTLDECAAILGCAGGTVRSHLSRALTALRRSLGD